MEPCRELVWIFQVVEAPVGPDERLLRGILDIVGIAEKRENRSDDACPVLVHKPAKGILTALFTTGNEFLV